MESDSPRKTVTDPTTTEERHSRTSDSISMSLLDRHGDFDKDFSKQRSKEPTQSNIEDSISNDKQKSPERTSNNEDSISADRVLEQVEDLEDKPAETVDSNQEQYSDDPFQQEELEASEEYEDFEQDPDTMETFKESGDNFNENNRVEIENQETYKEEHTESRNEPVIEQDLVSTEAFAGDASVGSDTEQGQIGAEYEPKDMTPSRASSARRVRFSDNVTASSGQRSNFFITDKKGGKTSESEEVVTEDRS